MRKEKQETTKKKLDKRKLMVKIVAGALVAFTMLGTGYTLIYILINA